MRIYPPTQQKMDDTYKTIAKALGIKTWKCNVCQMVKRKGVTAVEAAAKLRVIKRVTQAGCVRHTVDVL